MCFLLDQILTEADYKELFKRCDAQMLNKCRNDPGQSLWVTLAHNAAQNKMVFIVELESITNQGMLIKISVSINHLIGDVDFFL